MSTLLHLVYEYRQLSGKCNAGVGLSMDEIETLCTIESLFGRHTDRGDTDLWACQRKFVRESVQLEARMRNDKGMIDRIDIINMDPNGMVCANAPYMNDGDVVELIFEDEELCITYRFKAVVKWLRDGEDDNFELGLQLVGIPLLIRHGLQLEAAEFARAAA